ncbi:MAG: hypothetical protein KTR31_27060 [Myxococcales bacterium]|nr:hypothetical protein [Myxococcales bacterium]
MTHRIAFLVSAGLLVQGCVINNDKWPRPRDLSQTWMVDRTRILGVRADPPEIAPGQRAEMSALIVQAPGEEEPLGVLWLACEDGGAGCATDLGALDLENVDLAQAQELGVIGFEPGLAPMYTAPTDVLDDLDERERREGLNVQVQLTAIPLDDLGETTGEIDFNALEVGFKRLVVSEATTPNNNPVLEAFTVDGLILPPEAEVIQVEAGQVYDLGIALSEFGGREVYEFLNSDGVVEERTEEPYAAWFSTGGTLNETITLWPFMEASWVAPEEGESGTWFSVVRDRRGGMSWWLQDWEVVPEP